jgi:hypothetical protein
MSKTGFFEESPGVRSSTRIQSFILLLYVMAFDTMIIYRDNFIVTYWFALLNLIFLVAVFTPKYLHKIVEAKMYKDEPK